MFRLPDQTLVLSATDVTNHLACAHLTQERRGIALGLRPRPRPVDDAHGDLVRERGEEHEAEQLLRLTREAGGDMVEIAQPGGPPTREGLAEAAAQTADAMRAGHRLIYQGAFFDGRWMGRADFLRRIEAPSVLGAYAYELLDTKLSRQVKPHVVHQLALYNRLAGEVQGYEHGFAHVVLGDGTEAPVDLTRYAALHRYVAAQLEVVVDAGPMASYPEPTDHCAICRLAEECANRRRADDHLSLVAAIRRDQREKLVELGLPTLGALAQAPAGLDVARLGEEAYELLRHQAGLQVRSRDERRPTRRHLQPAAAKGYAALPARDAGDIFFDLEGDPYIGHDGGIEYLWGWIDADGAYDCAWAHDTPAEKDALERFVDFVVERRRMHPGLHVFHYAPHEASKLQSLALKYATREEEVDDLLRNGVLVDLYRVVRQALQVGEESYSIKKLERHYRFERVEHSVREGGGSIIAYEQWLKTREDERLEAIRRYNEDDCRSTLALRDWLLEAMRPEAARDLRVDFAQYAEPEAEEQHDAPAWLPAVLALIDRLTDDLPTDEADDDADQSERRLLSHLLLYHRRESKPEYWRHFDLRDKTPVELIEEREGIGGIVFDPTIAPVPFKLSLDWTFTFPPQEHRLKPGDLFDVATGDEVKVVAIEEGTLRVRRGKKLPAPPVHGLIGTGPVRTAKLRDALVRSAQALLDGGPENRAARSILRRERPRLAGGPFLSSHDVGTEELVAATLALDGSHLVVQGPPGTGKTYNGARMITAALALGRKVGVTAPSHAAIHNLLRAVEAHAHEAGISFNGIYRGDGYESPHGLVASAAGPKDTLAEDFDLVAGTAWLLAPRDVGCFDLLFIDEAGQFALANAIAVGHCAGGIVLLGDPQQLPQVTQARHPGRSGGSVLDHLLQGAQTVPPDRGFFLGESWRMHPGVCAFVSERSYDGRLRSRAECVQRRIDAPGPIAGAGLRLLSVTHEGRSQDSPEEAAAIAAAVGELLGGGATVTDPDGLTRSLEAGDIMVVAPYNMAVDRIAAAVPGVRVGTVDRFQGQEAPVVFYAMTCSSGDDVPRGIDFLFDAHRLNVAISRAQCLAVLVASPRLLDANCRTLEAMALVDGVCRFVELAGELPSAPHAYAA